jgi:hypothetical protein
MGSLNGFLFFGIMVEEVMAPSAYLTQVSVGFHFLGAHFGSLRFSYGMLLATLLCVWTN